MLYAFYRFYMENEFKEISTFWHYIEYLKVL